jgi:RNA polymerase sigma-70 factor (sigma-E family)
MSPGSLRAPDALDDDGQEQTLVLTGRVDRDAEFTAFVVDSGPALVRTAWLLCGEQARAEDLAQQALLRTYLAWPRIRDPLAYARRAVATARIDSWRKRRLEVLTPPEDLRATGGDGADARAERDRLVRALMTLPARQRRIVVLRYLLDLPEAEVAADLGVSLGTVKSTASRGLDRLRAVLGDASGSATTPVAPRGGGHD